MGGSSGGYLALMVAMNDGKSTDGSIFADPQRLAESYQSLDPIDATSSKVQAAISYFPPTDWLNYGAKGKSVFDHPACRGSDGLLDFYEYDASHKRFNRITNGDRVAEELKKLSPVNLANTNAAPCLLFHGEQDNNVPLQQSQTMLESLQKCGTSVDLIIRPSAGHGWEDNTEDTNRIIKWCDTHMLHKQ
jgi:dipeptidyl aminopeptidase/acylaminoacyl peptidase